MNARVESQQTRARGDKWWWLRMAVLGVLALVVLILGALSAIGQVTDQHNEAEHLFSGNRGGGGPPPRELIRPRFDQRVDSTATFSVATLQFTLDDFSPTDGALRGTLGVVVNEAKYKAQFPASEIPDSMDIEFHSVNRIQVVKVPVSRPTAEPSQAIATPITLEAWGDAQAFPNDAYAVACLINLPSGFAYPSISLSVAPRLGEYEIYQSVNVAYFNILIGRTATQVRWIYTLALSPIVLLIALLWYSFSNRVEATTSALQAGVGLIALLPIRQVLVPNNVGVLTRVDIVLGVEFLLFIVVATLSQLRRHTDNRSTTGSQSGVKQAYNITTPSAISQRRTETPIRPTSSSPSQLSNILIAVAVLIASIVRAKPTRAGHRARNKSR